MNFKKAFSENQMNYYKIMVPSGSSADKMQAEVIKHVNNYLPGGKTKLLRSGDVLFLQSDSPQELGKIAEVFSFRLFQPSHEIIQNYTKLI